MSAASAPEDRALGIDLSSRAKLLVGGSDRQRYLNGQLTNDIRKASGDIAIYAAILNAKGRVNADVFVTAAGDDFLLDAEAELREAIAARLERYIIADDVKIEDVTTHFALFHVIAAEAPLVTSAVRVTRANRLGADGYDIWVLAADRERALQELKSAVTLLCADEAERLRIERGVPRWGRELTEEIIPVEANLEAAALDYAKGCYIGQEVISRMKMSGQTNKRLAGLISVNAEPLALGSRLFSMTDEKEAGWVTSATRSRRLGKEIALGYVKRGFGAVGQELRALSPAASSTGSVVVEVAELPFR
ncbi:MAG: hypothetical protein M3Z64_06755 [Verrucomicrobiota bacterium]|nr:hypothetical protein [Verrucomicrobiota bacterium]